MTKAAVDLATVATELYGIDPESFTEARNARAKEAAAAGDRELAAAIKKLGKPTAAAWLANRLVRSETATVDELIHLGPELRRAQSGGQRDEMRRLVEKRRALIADLVKSAPRAAAQGGHSFGASVERQLEETLEAAVADEALGGALREGRLTEPFRFVGFGETPEQGHRSPLQAPGPRGDRAAARVKTKAGTATSTTGRTESATDAEARRAEAAREAQVERRAAREALDEIEASFEKARRRLEAADERLGRASKLMGEAEAEKAAATDVFKRAREALGPARRRLKKLDDAEKRPIRS